jgi:hypothetical protein
MTTTIPTTTTSDRMLGAVSQEEFSTPETIILRTTDALRKLEGADDALVSILAENILTMKPANTAVVDAVKAIEKLAAKRAEGAEDEQSNND